MTRKCIFTGATIQRNIRPHAGCVHPTCPNNAKGSFNGDSCPSCRPAGITPHSEDGIRHQRPRKR